MNSSYLKYLSVCSLSLQRELSFRASFLMERARAITIVIAFYAFWSVLFLERSLVMGYSQSQMITYVLGMNLLRSLILSDQNWEMIREINTGRIASYLIRPISYFGFCISRDLVDKLLNFLSAILEMALALWILDVPLYFPKNFSSLFFFVLMILLSLVLYFLLSYAVSALAFWTAESGGPRFCFELFVEFAAGAFFPLDVLPQAVKNFFQLLPFASMVYLPLNIFLERADFSEILKGIAVSLAWIFLLALLCRAVWKRGLKNFSAYGI